jgi:outer membrane protein assembly factor BamA
VRAWLIVFLLLLPVVRPGALRAQAGTAASAGKAAEQEHPLVESVTFTGVHSVETHEILATLATQPTVCRTFILKPLCALTHSHLFEVRHYLDRPELPRDELRIKVFYWLRGYRHTQVATAVTPKGRGVAVTFAVTEGPPTLIQSVAVTQTDSLLTTRQIRRSGLPRAGRPINLVDLDSLETRLRRTLWDRGYANTEVRDTAQPVDSLRVALRVQIDPGPKTTVDSIVVAGNRLVTARTIRRLVGLGHGDLFRREDLLQG